MGYPVEAAGTFSDIFVSFDARQSSFIQWSSALGIANAQNITDF